ncbi:MAG TPA: S8 family serine peptidase [Longimicrobiales bacterium]
MQTSVRQHLPMLALVLGVALGGCSRDATAPAARAPRLATASAGGRYIVLVTGPGMPSGFGARVAALGGQVAFAHDSAGVAVVSGLTPASASQLAASTGVVGVQAEDTVSLAPPGPGVPLASSGSTASVGNPAAALAYAAQWNLRAIHADQAWAAGRLGSPGVTVAIIDTGIDYTHPELAGHVDLSRSVSFVPSDDALVDALFPGKNHVTDLHAHGTAVANVVTGNAIVVAGVTSRLTLMAVKACTVQGLCNGGAVLRGILWAADHGADVANISIAGAFGRPGNGGSVALLNRILDYATRKGMTVVVGAGNAALDLDANGNAYNNYCETVQVVCVSATGPTASGGVFGPFQNVDAPAPYTNYGRSAISVAAPGGTEAAFIYQACSQTSLVIPICQTGFYVVGADGTSLASPHAAALAALLVEQLGRNPALVKARLQQTADDLGQPGTDPFYGKGRINVAAALGL